MPSKYTMQTLPKSLDTDIILREIPPRKMAAIRYSGTWNRKRNDVNKSQLEQFLKRKGLQTTGEAIFARYNPPFQLWFMRRNEVLIPVE